MDIHNASIRDGVSGSSSARLRYARYPRRRSLHSHVARCPVTAYLGGVEDEDPMCATLLANAEVFLLDVKWLEDWRKSFSGSIIDTSRFSPFLGRWVHALRIDFQDRRLMKSQALKVRCSPISWIRSVRSGRWHRLHPAIRACSQDELRRLAVRPIQVTSSTCTHGY